MLSCGGWKGHQARCFEPRDELPFAYLKTSWERDIHDSCAHGAETNHILRDYVLLSTSASVRATDSRCPGFKTLTLQCSHRVFRKRGLPTHRSLPFRSIATRSPRCSASSMKCVESNVHLPARPRRRRSHVKRLEYGSIPFVKRRIRRDKRKVDPGGT